MNMDMLEKTKNKNIGNEVVAYNLVKLYLQETARLGLKRKFDLDSVINAYFYTLDRVNNKSAELKKVDSLEKDEEKISLTKKEALKGFN